VDLIAFCAHRLADRDPRAEASPMDKFIERQNIAHYEDQLKTETEPIRSLTFGIWEK
jgi:hypothetical protein